MIHLHPTKIVIDNYDMEQVDQLEKSLSVFDRTIFQYTFSAFMHDDDERKLIIPGGYDLGKLKQFFPRDEFVNHKKEINSHNEVKFSLKFPPRDDLQRAAIDFLLKNNNPQKFLCLPTGKGKTYCSIHYVFRTKKLPIVLVDLESLAEQWKQAVMFFTTIKEEEIFYIAGKESIEKLMKMSKKELSKYKFFIAVHRTLKNHLERDFDNIDKLFSHLGIGVKLYDEAHVEMKNIFYVDSLSNTESIYITATPTRSDPIENKVYQNMFKGVPMFRVHDDAVEKYHNVLIVKYSSKPSLDDQAKMKNRHGFDSNAWSKYILQDGKYENFMNIILQIVKKFNKNNDKKMLFLFHTMEGNAIIHEDFTNEFPNLTVGRFDSSIKNKDKRNLELEKDLIVSTDKSFGKAIDVKGLEVTFNTVPFGSKTMAEQMMGRLREIPDKEVWFIDFNDIGFESISRQLKQKKSIYNKKAKNVYELDLTK
jgi:superfamily II DNA or RNA helicase